MKRRILSLAITGAVFFLAGCAADKEMGLCSTLGLCPDDEESECAEDGGGCENTLGSSTAAHHPTDHTADHTADHGVGSDDNNH